MSDLIRTAIPKMNKNKEIYERVTSSRSCKRAVLISENFCSSALPFYRNGRSFRYAPRRSLADVHRTSQRLGRRLACPVDDVVAGQQVLHSLAKRVQSDFRRTV
jgi:hypothetical protein